MLEGNDQGHVETGCPGPTMATFFTKMCMRRTRDGLDDRTDHLPQGDEAGGRVGTKVLVVSRDGKVRRL